MFKLNKFYIACCLLGLVIYTTPALANVCFAPSGGCYDLNGNYVESDRDSPVTLTDCAGFNYGKLEEGPGWNCQTCVQASGATLYKCEKNKCSSSYNILKNQDEEPKERPGWECEFCWSGYDKFWYCPKHYCEPKYGPIKVSASASPFNCVDTCPHGDDILYNCFCDSEHVEKDGSCVRECDANIHREYNPSTDTCDCESDYVERNGSCVHRDYSADCQAVVDNFVAKSYSPLSNSDCKALKVRLGISKCIGSTDYWAGAVKACGGVDLLPNKDELTKLAQCMYSSSSLASAIYGHRNTSYLETLGLSTDDHVFVWSNTQSKKNTMSVVRMFATYGSIPYWAERDGSKYYIGNGTGPTDWENTSILSQTLCRRDGEVPEPVESCEGCNYCIPSTCKDSGQLRIISDSSTYEKCADNCNGKYKCKSGYVPQYAGSNQYKCVLASEQCAGFDLASAPVLGNCSSCSGKYRCGTETTMITYGTVSSKVCFNGCDTLNYDNCHYHSGASKYVNNPSECPSGTTAFPTGKLFNTDMFNGNPLHNMECYYCQGSGSGGCDYTQPAMKIECTLKNSTTFSCKMTYQSNCCKHIGGVTFKHGSEILKTVGLTSGSWEMPNTVIDTCFFSDYASPTDGEVGTTTWGNDGQGHYGCSITLNPSQCSSPTTGNNTTTCPTGYTPKANLTNISSCGTSGTQGWTLETSSSNANCVKCKKKDCPAGSCTNGSPQGVFAGYSGNDACYQDQICDGDDDVCICNCPNGYWWDVNGNSGSAPGYTCYNPHGDPGDWSSAAVCGDSGRCDCPALTSCP